MLIIIRVKTYLTKSFKSLSMCESKYTEKISILNNISEEPFYNVIYDCCTRGYDSISK